MARVDINHDGIGEILKSEGVQAFMLERGERVRAGCEADAVTVHSVDERPEERIPMPYRVESHTTKTRAVVRVYAAHPAGMNAERKYHTLARNLDKAGGE